VRGVIVASPASTMSDLFTHAVKLPPEQQAIRAKCFHPTGTMSLHASTHMDAPFHFILDGKTTDELPLDLFIGPVLVHQVAADRYLTAEHVAGIELGGTTRRRTRYGRERRHHYI